MGHRNWLFGKDGALFHAIASGNAEMVKFLIQEGADVNVTSGDGFTPLHRAAQKGLSDIVKILLEHAADPSTQTNEEQTPLALAEANGFLETAEILRCHHTEQ